MKKYNNQNKNKNGLIKSKVFNYQPNIPFYKIFIL